MAVFARVRARPRVRAPRGVDHRAGRRRLHEWHEQHGEQAERQDSVAATAADVPLAVPLVVMKMRRASAVPLLVMKSAACRLPSLGIERRRRRRRLCCGGRRFAVPTLPTNAAAGRHACLAVRAGDRGALVAYRLVMRRTPAGRCCTPAKSSESLFLRLLRKMLILSLRTLLRVNSVCRQCK